MLISVSLQSKVDAAADEVPVDKSHAKALSVARAHGLVHIGFGNYAKKAGGKVTHRIRKDDKGVYQLYKVNPTKTATPKAAPKSESVKPATPKAAPKSESVKPATPKAAPKKKLVNADKHGRDLSEDVGGSVSYQSAVESYKQFSSSKAHDEWSEKHYADWYKSLNVDERKALIDYKDESYDVINDSLRGHKGRSMDQETIKKTVELMDKAIKRAKLPNDQEVFRGITMSHPDLISPNFDYSHLVGRELSDKGFTSVTTRAGVTEDFLHTGPDSVFIKMTLPKGSNVASLNKGVAGDEPDLKVRNANESELLLPRGMKFMVKSVEKVKKHERPPAHIMHVVPVFPDEA